MHNQHKRLLILRYTWTIETLRRAFGTYIISMMRERRFQKFRDDVWDGKSVVITTENKIVITLNAETGSFRFECSDDVTVAKIAERMNVDAKGRFVILSIPPELRDSIDIQETATRVA